MKRLLITRLSKILNMSPYYIKVFVIDFPRNEEVGDTRMVKYMLNIGRKRI